MPSVIKDTFKGKIPPPPAERGPLWEGPAGAGPNGGVTQSLISRWLSCRERFRLHAIEGLCPAERFRHALEYGRMWHVCEEALAGIHRDATVGGKWKAAVEWALTQHAEALVQKFPLQREEIEHWASVCATQFPLYVAHWEAHPDVVNRWPLLQEHVFDVVYPLPSGRQVRLRGRWDSVDLVGKGGAAGVWLMENKTKGDIREGQLRRQLGSGFDLQTLTYLVALREWKEQGGKGVPTNLLCKLGGVRYNVIRRPLSGGKGSIVRHKATKKNPAGESFDAFYARLGGIITSSPNDFFYRWQVVVTPQDILRFRAECLNPVLEQLCQWWEWMQTDALGTPATPFASGSGIHWRTPYGMHSRVQEVGEDDLDEHLKTCSMVGLRRADRLFEELE